MEKNCVQHADAPAVAACKVCEKSLCLMCTTEVAGDIFCSPKCADVFSEVKDWIEPKAKPEEWNPLADPSSNVSQLPHDDTALELEQMVRPGESQPVPSLPEDESLLDMSRIKAEMPPSKPEDWTTSAEEAEEGASLPQDESLLDMTRMPVASADAAPPSAPPEAPDPTVLIPGSAADAASMCAHHPEAWAVGSCTKCTQPFCVNCAVETSWGTFCSVECSVGYQTPVQAKAPPSRALPAILGIAAAALVVLGILVLSWGNKAKSPPSGEGTGAVAHAPPSPESPNPEPVRPEPAKPEPVKLEPAKPEPVKPEPVKPEPPKPLVKVDPPKPEPAKPEPPKPEPPPPVVKVEPPKMVAPPRYRLLARDPWMGEKLGAWYRFRTATPSGETYSDVGLKERGPDFVVLVSQSRSAGQAAPERQDRVELGELSVVRVERFLRRGVTHDFEVLEPKTGQGQWRWVVREGKYAGATLPEDWVAHKIEPERFGEQSLQVRDRTFECLIVESGDRIWLSAACPLGEVRREGEGTVRELVDYGDDWSRRPPIPQPQPAPLAKVEPPKPVVKPEPPRPEPPKPEPPKPVVKVEPAKPEPPKPEPPKPEPAKPEPPKPVVKVEPAKPEPPKPEPPRPEPAKPEPPKPVVKVDPPTPEPPREDPGLRARRNLDQAALLIRQATPLFKEIADSMEAVGSERNELQRLLEKVEEVRRRLREARKLYAESRSEAPDPGVVEGRIRKLDSLLETTADCVDQIKSKL